MGRRSDHSKEELQDMALTSARDIVESQGLGGLSARKIANKIGYTVGTLYLVFQNLDDLIMQLNGRTLDELYAYLQESIRHCKRPESQIHKLGRAYIQFATEQKNLWSAVFEHQLSDEEEIPDWYMEKVIANFNLVENALLPHGKNMDAKQLHQASRALWGGVHGICVLALGGKMHVAGIDSIHSLTDNLIKTFLAGLNSL